MQQPLIADSEVLPVRPSEPVCSVRNSIVASCITNKILLFSLDNAQIYFLIVIIYSTQYYEKTGKCKFGAKCRFNHPKDNEVPTLTGKQTIYTANIDAEVYNVTTDGSIPANKHTPAAPAEAHNAKGLPIRPVHFSLFFGCVCVCRVVKLILL
jgi:hypothetical protein